MAQKDGPQNGLLALFYLIETNSSLALSGLEFCLSFYHGDKHHDQKLPGEDRADSSLQLSGHTPSLREVRVGADAEAMEGCCLLACSS